MTNQVVPDGLAGTISLGLHAHELSPIDQIETLRRQARLAEDVGFDGVTLSEHHGGRRGYWPCPMELSAALLGWLNSAWCGALPTLLPLRPARVVVEQSAWLSAAYPHRVVTGLVAGYLESDYTAVGIDPSERWMRWSSGLELIAGLFAQGVSDSSTSDSLDPAIKEWSANVHTVTVGASTRSSCARVARLGFPLLLGASSIESGGRSLAQSYRSNGGGGSITGIMRIWIGKPPASVSGLDRARRSGVRVDSSRGIFVAPSGSSLAEELSHVAHRCSLNAMNLRVHLPDVEPAEVASQLELMSEAIPMIQSQCDFDVRRPKGDLQCR